METLVVVIPALAISFIAIRVRAHRRAARWLTDSGVQKGEKPVEDGVRVIDGRRATLTILDPFLLAPRVDVDVELAIPADEVRKRQRDPRVVRLTRDLAKDARARLVFVRSETLRVRARVVAGGASAGRLIDVCCALARALEDAAIHAVDGEGSAAGAPVAVRALGGDDGRR